jgi:hypothetical protein
MEDLQAKEVAVLILHARGGLNLLEGLQSPRVIVLSTMTYELWTAHGHSLVATDQAKGNTSIASATM